MVADIQAPITIQVNTPAGPTGLTVKPMAVSASGRLALHPCVGLVGGWSFTHIPTGWACGHGKNMTLAVARECMAVLDELDWNFEQVCKLPPTTAAAMPAIVSRWGIGKPELSPEYVAACFAEPIVQKD